jgi:hypothetical protein
MYRRVKIDDTGEKKERKVCCFILWTARVHNNGVFEKDDQTTPLSVALKHGVRSTGYSVLSVCLSAS